VDDADDVGPTSDEKEGRMRPTTHHTLRSTGAHLAATAALTAAALGVGIGAGSAEAAPAAKWTRLTPPGHALKDTDEIAIDRDIFGALDLVWRNGNTIQHGRLDPDLKTVSGPHTVAAYSGGINGEVDLDTRPVTRPATRTPRCLAARGRTRASASIRSPARSWAPGTCSTRTASR
jgi:hypothetical protein